METSQAVATGDTFVAQSFELTRWKKVASVLQRVPIFPLLILVTLVFTAVSAGFIAPHNPEVGNLRYRYRPPVWQDRGSWEYILGTDHMGRDVLSRLIYGSRISLIVAVTASLFAGVVGTTLGILSGFRGGWVDQVIM